MSIPPSVNLNFTNSTLDPRITFTRSAATATRVNSIGFVEAMAADTPRFDFDSVTLVCKGLLIEEDRTNLRSYSEEFDNTGIWARTNSSVSANFASVIAPDGSTNSDKLIANIGATTNVLVVSSLSLTSGTTYTYSCYAKAGERNVVRLRIIGTAGWASVIVNLTTGTVTSSTGTVVVTEEKDGWYRIAVTAVCDKTGSNAVYVYDNTGTAGNGTDGIYIFGAQLEAGDSATSYIPTTTTAVTRNPDVATITGVNFSDFWQASKGGAQVQVIPSTVSGIRPLVQYDDGTADNLIALRGNAANPELHIVDGGAPQVQLDAGTIVANTPYSLTGWWQTNDCKARKDSGAVVTDDTATIPTVTQARLGSDGTNYLNGHLATINYYDTFSGQIYTRRKNKVFSSLL